MKKSLSFLWESHDPEHGLETITEASEDKSKPKQYYLQGPFLMAEQKNKNGRVYDLEECKKEVERYKKEYIDTNRAIGELGHPKDSITVNERNGCHRIVDMVQDGNLFYGKTLILPTESGKIVQGYLDGGTKMGISTRGLGKLTERNGTNYVSDFHLVCLDLVLDPSAAPALLDCVLESRQWLVDTENFDESIKQLKKSVDVLPVKESQEYAARKFKEWFNALKCGARF